MTRNRIRLSDVARQAGVSAATVSRAINQPDLLSEETLARVRGAADRLGYRPDAAAQALVSGRSRTIGAVMPTLDSPIFARVLHALQAGLAIEGYHLLVAAHDYSMAGEAEAVRLLLGRGVDGLVLVGAERAPETAAMLRSSGVPLVLTFCADPHIPSVAIDNEKAGALAAQHLTGLGHRRIGMICGALRFNDRQKARVEGARHALEAEGLALPDSMICEQPATLAGGRTGCAILLGLAAPPTGIIVGIDMMAIGCLIEAQAHGLSAPADLSVVGIDDLDMSAHVSPALTTVHLPIARIGAEAAAKMVAILAERPFETRTDLPVELVIRRSTAQVQAR